MSVHPDELNGTEQAVLLVLMAEASEARPLPNAHLKRFGPELTKPQRDRLLRKGLIEVHGKPMTLNLSDTGWRMCGEIIGADAPTGVTGQKKALYTVLKAVRRYLDRADLAPADALHIADEVTVEARVRRAYASLTDRPGGWVGLRRLRDALPDVPRTDLDRELVRLYRDPGVSLIPEENQKTLTDDDRAAAVTIGDKDNHVLAIHS